MSVTSGFFNSLNGDRKYNAQQMSAIFNGIINDGVFANIGTAFMVTADSGFNIHVGIGRAWFNSVWINSDTILPMTLDAAELVLDRIDAIVIDVDHSDSVRDGTIKYVKGTPASSPVRPTMIDSTYQHQHPLAYIYRPAGSTSIAQSNITIMVGTSDCPYITGILQVQNIDNIVAQWGAQWVEWYGATTGYGEAEINQIIAEWNDWFEVQTTQSSAEMSQWFTQMKSDFNEWFASLEIILDGEVATSFATRILELEERFTDLAEDQCVYLSIEDSNGDPVSDNVGDAIEGKTVFSSGGSEEIAKVEKQLADHANDVTIHVSPDEKDVWNQKADVAQIGFVTLPLLSWTQDELTKIYSQSVALSGITENSKVDFDADISTLANITSSIHPVNENGSLKALTKKLPKADVTIQVTITNTKNLPDTTPVNIQGGVA